MSLPAIYIEEIKRILDAISQNLPGYSTRMAQKKMIAAIATVFSRAEEYKEAEKDEEKKERPENTGKTIVCIEGPTGVGKSLGYLIGAAVAAQNKKRKIVIASATVALQEQLAKRDIPFFIENSGKKLTCVIAKGRSRYVCHERMRRIVGSSVHDDMFMEEGHEQHNQQDTQIFANLLTLYEGRIWSGDRDDLPSPVNDAVWGAMTTDRNGCLNSKCACFRTCAQMKARDGIKEADIVVANHDLLLADMALGGGVILPAPEVSFYILDEAHHLPVKAASAFSAEHRVDGGRSMMNKLSALAVQVGGAFPEIKTIAIPLSDSAESLARRLGEVYTMLNRIDVAAYSGNLWRFPENRFPVEAAELGRAVRLLSETVTQETTKLLDKLDKLAADDEVAKKMFSDIGFYNGKADAIQRTWEMLLTDPGKNIPPTAKWVERIVKPNNVVEFNLKACPVIAGGLLRASFFSKTDGVVLTSATLRTLGNFDSFLRDCGLDRMPDVSTLALPSPFNYLEQGVLYVPDIKANPKNAVEHTRAIISVMPEAIRATGDKGTLVLFSSRKQMIEVFEGMPKETRALVLVQDEQPKGLLIKKHLARIEKGLASVLFGLQSFAEGLDLPGDACAHVVIAKIPFAVPSDPIQETLSEWLAARNRSYFSEVALPQASLRMIQAAGRLIRTESDRGVISILDGRITTTSYGKQILNSLPPFARAGTGEAAIAAFSII